MATISKRARKYRKRNGKWCDSLLLGKRRDKKAKVLNKETP
jgi:hypothetical protein